MRREAQKELQYRDKSFERMEKVQTEFRRQDSMLGVTLLGLQASNGGSA